MKDDLSPQQAGDFLGKSRQFVILIIEAGEIEYTDERAPGSKRPYYRLTREACLQWKRTRRGNTRNMGAKAIAVTTGLLSRMREARRLRQAHAPARD